MDEFFELMEEIYDLQMKWENLLFEQQVLLLSRVSCSRGRYDEVNRELREVCDECSRIGVLLGEKELELEKF